MWIPEFMDYCKTNNVPFDFIATHEYPTDPPGPQTRDFFKNVLQTTRAAVGSLPLYYSEYDDGYDGTRRPWRVWHAHARDVELTLYRRH